MRRFCLCVLASAVLAFALVGVAYMRSNAAGGRILVDALNSADLTGFNGANQLVQMTSETKLPAVDGSALTSLTATNVTLGTTRPYDYILIQEQQAQNTNGGTFTAGAWTARVLNTEVTDTGGNASVASNQITLAAGTYEASIRCPAYQVARHQARLWNVTDATTVLTGISSFSATGADADGLPAVIVGRFTLAAQKVLEVQHYGQVTVNTNGYGIACNFTTEIYTSVELRRVGL